MSGEVLFNEDEKIMGEYDDSEFCLLMKCGESYWNELNFECEYTQIGCPCQKGNWYQTCVIKFMKEV